jgi:SAM-dependent methyltransferase
MIVPDYVRSYQLHLEHLIKHHGREAAMELVVGGQYQQIGILESSALVTLGLLPDHTLVDVGCGSGRLAFHLKSYLSGKYIGTDILEASLRFASEKCGRDDWSLFRTTFRPSL